MFPVRSVRHAAVALLLSGGMAGNALADVNNGGLQLCNPGQGTGTSIGITPGSTTPIACRGAYYSFWLGNGVNGTGGGTNDTTAAVWGNAAGQLHLVGNSGVFLDGNSIFGGTANLNNNRITGLADGTAATDAVNLRQLNDALAAGMDDKYIKVVSGSYAAPVEASVTGSALMAIGASAEASGTSASAIGGGSVARGQNATAVGTIARAGYESTALGVGAIAEADYSVVVGRGARSTANAGAALGTFASVTASNAVALGANSVADRANSVSVGSASQQRQVTNMAAGAADNDAVNLAQLKHTAQSVANALGGGAGVLPDGGVSAPVYDMGDRKMDNVGDAIDYLRDADQALTTGLGQAMGSIDDLTYGRRGMVTHDPQTGDTHIAQRVGGDVLAVDGEDGRRRLSGLANGLHDDEAVTIAQLKAAGVLDPAGGSILSALTYDDVSLSRATLGGTHGTVLDNLAAGQVAAGGRQAVNGGQLFESLASAASMLGGGASVGLQGVFVAPSYLVQGATYHDVGSALTALDGKVSEIDQRVAGLDAGAASVRSGRASVASVAARDTEAAPAPAAMPASGDTESASTPGTVAEVAQGTDAADTVGKAQLDRGVASANTYTDTKFQGLSDSFEVFKGDVDQRLRGMDRRIDRQGAMSAAMLNMATSAAGVRTDNRVGVGVGFQGGQSAMSVGYQRAISERATVTLGGAFSGDDASVGFGAGFGW